MDLRGCDRAWLGRQRASLFSNVLHPAWGACSRGGTHSVCPVDAAPTPVLERTSHDLGLGRECRCSWALHRVVRDRHERLKTGPGGMLPLNLSPRICAYPITRCTNQNNPIAAIRIEPGMTILWRY